MSLFSKGSTSPEQREDKCLAPNTVVDVVGQTAGVVENSVFRPVKGDDECLGTFVDLGKRRQSPDDQQ